MNRDSVNSYQVGGSHYNKDGTLQLWDFVSQNNLGYVEGNIIKYITRWKKKGGVQDIEKAIHYLQKLRQLYEDKVLFLPPVRIPQGLEIYRKENNLSDLEYTAFTLLLTYTTLDELYRVFILLNHILAAAEATHEVHEGRKEGASEGI